ncbi:hypothetical protein [Streptomyces sp. NPDC048603]|uniref:hypothetical protein n=1 Tax=Streptomyces sp. NPDC048603 TaxID=3365577 RepID=UPI00371AA271
MRGDETQRAVAPDAESRERKGPRHAAPRKSLLTKLQIPVGKTMALAAMPTAVFVGMGMGPKLALADEKDIPFAPGPCVTRSDEPKDEESKSASPSPSASKSPSKTPSPGASPGASPSARSSKAPAPTPSASSSSQAKPQKQSPSAPTASPSPTATQKADPLDPLGLSDKVGDFFDGLTGKQPTATPTAPAAPTTPAPSQPPAAPHPQEQAIRDAAKQAGVRVGELSDEVKGTKANPKDETGKPGTGDEQTGIKDAKDDTSAKDAEDDKAADAKKDKDGKEPFPCPTYDAKALAEAELEPGIPLLPDEPWYLDSSLLTLYGLKYHGIVEVKTGSGKVKKVLKFTADSLDIKDLYQTVGKSGNVAHLKSRPGSTSKIRGGTVTMYTESLKGNLFGIIPIEFSPNSPPPLDVPFAFFTKVKVVQAGQFGGTLTVPGLKNYIGPPE